MSPASARTRVRWETVGWLLPRGSWRCQLHTSPWAARIDISRSRTGSASAPSTAARATESLSDSGTSVSGGPHSASSMSERVTVARMTVDAISDLNLSCTPPLGSPWEAVQMGAQAWVPGTRRH